LGSLDLLFLSHQVNPDLMTARLIGKEKLDERIALLSPIGTLLIHRSVFQSA
jgi:hypothetical protein